MPINENEYYIMSPIKKLVFVENKTYNAESTHISFRRNNLISFPSTVLQLTLLINLDLEGNNLQTIPHYIGELHLLQYLDVSNNKLKIFPHSILLLKKLKSLNLDNNQLDIIPDNIPNMNLQTFSIRNNNLTYISKGICNLQELVILNMDNNYIKSVPDILLAMPKLRSLSITNNLLTMVPKESSKLNPIHLKGNPLIFSIDQTHNNSKKSIEHYFTVMDNCTKIIHTIKLRAWIRKYIVQAYYSYLVSI